jgi:hypothetical protein
MSVGNIELDLYNYPQTSQCGFRFTWGFFEFRDDFQIYTEYIDSHSYWAVVRRIDKDFGWETDMYLLPSLGTPIHMGASISPQKKILVQVNFDLIKGDITILKESYSLVEAGIPASISREEFNESFDTDIVVLPTCLYAAGIHDGKFVMYNEAYSAYYEVLKVITFIASVGLTYFSGINFYCIVSWRDGYVQECFHEVRDIPQIIGEYECKGEDWLKYLAPGRYPVFHSRRIVLGLNVSKDWAYTLPVIDNYRLAFNHYKQYRSIHSNIPFSSKKNRIIYGCDTQL